MNANAKSSVHKAGRVREKCTLLLCFFRPRSWRVLQWARDQSLTQGKLKKRNTAKLFFQPFTCIMAHFSP